MILNYKHDMKHFLTKILKNDTYHTYSVATDGALMIDSKYLTGTFLAYVNGHWYGARDGRRGASELSRDKSRFLFAITESKFWAMRNDGCAEYASPTKPLSTDTVSFLLVDQEEGICLFIIDGSKHPSPLMFLVGADPEDLQIFGVIMSALVRQYDPVAAKHMEDFWFNNIAEASNTAPTIENKPYLTLCE